MEWVDTSFRQEGEDVQEVEGDVGGAGAVRAFQWERDQMRQVQQAASKVMKRQFPEVVPEVVENTIMSYIRSSRGL